MKAGHGGTHLLSQLLEGRDRKTLGFRQACVKVAAKPCLKNEIKSKGLGDSKR
jgi:hypothetical protein